MKRVILLVCVSFLISAVCPPAWSAWQQNGVPVSTANFEQQQPLVIPDGSGGAIIAWLDNRDLNYYDLYAQRVNFAGNTLWTANGVVLSTGPVTIFDGVPDGAGGAFIGVAGVGGGGIYLQHVDLSGNLDWSPSGVSLATGGVDGGMISDGAGGVIVAWAGPFADHDVRAQHVDAAGNALWTAGGVVLCTRATYYGQISVVPDGGAGAVVTWVNTDYVSSDMDVYARRVDASGTALWTADGVLVCDNPNNGPYTASYAVIASDGAGGAFVAYNKWINNVPELYAQRVDGSGTVAWAGDGVALGPSNFYDFPEIVADGVGGAIVAWAQGDIYAQKLDGSGNLLWTSGGAPVCTAANDQVNLSLVADGSGGAIFAWDDWRAGGFPEVGDVYAHRLDAGGSPLWASDGVQLCNSSSGWGTSVALDGAGGAIVAWTDGRNASDDVFAQRVLLTGEIPSAVDRPTRGPSLVASEVYPNPFSGAAWIELNVPTPSPVRIEVFDVSGRSVRSIEIRNVAGFRRVEFDGRDESGRVLAGGVYFCRVEAAGETLTRKMVISR